MSALDERWHSCRRKSCAVEEYFAAVPLCPVCGKKGAKVKVATKRDKTTRQVAPVGFTGHDYRRQVSLLTGSPYGG